MRKLYALLAGLCIGLASMKTIAQQPTGDLANFTYAINVSDNNVVFTNTSTIGTEPGNRRAFWSFGDGISQWSHQLDNAKHDYPLAGTYTVCLRIYRYATNSNDPVLSAEICKTIVIEPKCRADFERLPVTSANDPLQIHLKALPWHNNNKKPEAICWYFGDGKDTCIKYEPTYTGSYTIVHRYKEPGQYEVCIKVFYDGGCEAKWCKQIIIERSDRCNVDFEQIPITANTPLTAHFRAIPKHNENKKPEKVCWKFGDGKDTCIKYEPGFTGQYTVAHHYLQPGQYEVCVYISYAGGCEAKLCKVTRIGEPDKCSVDFERSPLQDNDPLTIGLKAIPWNNNNHKPVAVCWYFGDGKDSCIKYEPTYAGIYAIAHRYKEPGQYEVCIKIFYYGGCEAKNCKFIVVPPPQNTCTVRLFEIVPSVTSLVRGFFVSTSSTSDKKPERICWYFGDGTDTCVQTDTPNPTSFPDNLIRHTYPAPGVYKACVKVLFQGGCIAYDCVEVVIRSATDICGGYLIDSLTRPRTFKFKGFSIHNRNDEVVGYRWTFGDGSAAAGQEVKHTYNEGGTYEVCLYIKTRLGCETKVCKAVRVPGNNQPALQLSPNPVINILHVQFFSTRTEQVNIKIVSASGVTVKSYTRNVTAGQNNWDIELGSLVQGVYSFVLQSPNQLASAIFLKQ